jgi:peptidoglycan/LPS O-acetylase OafA/YrhL
MDGNTGTLSLSTERRRNSALGGAGGLARPRRLSAAASLTLDVVRFLAAVTVALGHISLPIFSTGVRPMMGAAAGAVGVFFVLSGFIIRYVTLSRASNLAVYLADRASRLYSVVLPALGFTVFAELIAVLFHRAAWSTTAGDYVLRFFATATYMSETWFQDLAPAWNEPFWSLSFEAFYYVIYGVGFYLKGWKRIALLFAVALLAGPSILLLAPVWFLGSYLLDSYQRFRGSRRRSLWVVAAIVAGGALAAGLVRAIPQFKRAAVSAWIFHFNQKFVGWGMPRVSTWYYETGIVSAFVLLAALLLFDRVDLSPNSRSVRLMRYVADGTFPLYLFHVPMLYLVRALVPYDPGSRWQLAAILAGVTIVSILLGGVCNRLKDVLRRLFHRAEGVA